MKTENMAKDHMNSIDWALSLNSNQVVDVLKTIVDPRSLNIGKDSKYPNEIRFKFYLKRSLIWGAGLRKEIEAEGAIKDLDESSSRLVVEFGIYSPYKYIKLSLKTGIALFLICIIAWAGLFIDMFIKPLKYASPSLELLLFVSGFVFFIGANRSFFIEPKLRKFMVTFQNKFGPFIKK
jgi:hypothetical protein